MLILSVMLQVLNVAHGNMADLHSSFFGLPHMLALVKLLGSRSLPWLVRALLDFLSQKVGNRALFSQRFLTAFEGTLQLQSNKYCPSAVFLCSLLLPE